MLSKVRANILLPAGCSLRQGPWPAIGPLARPVRQQVFINEQQVDPALEWDEHDAHAWHAVVLHADAAVGTARLLASRNGIARIGRMAVLSGHRQHGLGGALLEAMLLAACARGDHAAVLHAQCHAQAFYERAGFVACGAAFMEAGIEHVEMRLSLRLDTPHSADEEGNS